MNKALVLGLFLWASWVKSDLGPAKLLAGMSMRQKIGQLFVVAAASNADDPSEILATLAQKNPYKNPYNVNQDYIEQLITQYQIGGVIFLYKSVPQKQLTLTNKWQKMAQIPLLIAQDSEWGLSMRLDLDPDQVVRYPRNMTLGAIADPQIIYELGYEIGQQCRALGVHLNLAPVVDVNNNPKNPVIHDRAFGDQPDHVAKWGAFFMQGLQAAGILACAKHFPGHGDTVVDSHVGLPVIGHSREYLNQAELVPFKKLIKSGVQAVMLGHLVVPSLDESGQIASLSPKIVTDLLQNELGFNGLKITDGLGMQAVMTSYLPGELELQAFLAGNDLLLCPLDVPKAIELIANAILVGQVNENELDRRVLKILQAKAQVVSQQTLEHEQVMQFLTRPAAYALQARAYRAAITQINHDQAPVFDPTGFAKSCIMQVGDLPENYLINSRAKQHKLVFNYTKNFSDLDLQAGLKAAQAHEQIIIAVGDMTKNLNNNFGIAPNLVNLVCKLRELGKAVIVVLFGSPYAVSLFKQASTILVAYEDLPVVQQAILDVLQGKFEPTGVLPIKI